jgi:prevent-host-death family protein
MTIYGYNMVMKEVKTAELKAKLSEYLRLVRRGESVTVFDREQPIARIVPYVSGPALRVRRPRPGSARPGDVRLPAPLRVRTDVVALLIADRERER